MAEPIPLFSAEAANRGIDLHKAAARVIDSHRYVMGQEVTAFEDAFASYCGTARCIGLGNGTDALELGLRALGVGSGDTVVMAANAGFYGSTAARLVGAIPRYVDIDPDTLTVCPRALQTVLRDGDAKAVIATHLYGQLADMDGIMATARRYGVPVIEDCAQAHGARRGGRVAGSFGALGTYSFYPTKNLGALGDGGAVVTNDYGLAERIERLRQYGWGMKYRVEVAHGRNSRLDEMQAAILREKLPFLDDANRARRSIAARYNFAFEPLEVTPPRSIGEDFVAHLYVIRVRQRDAFREYLRARGIATDVHYPIADYSQPAYRGDSMGMMDETARACAGVVTLPCYPGMPDVHVQRVIEAVAAYFDVAERRPC